MNLCRCSEKYTQPVLLISGEWLLPQITKAGARNLPERIHNNKLLHKNPGLLTPTEKQELYLQAHKNMPAGNT